MNMKTARELAPDPQSVRRLHEAAGTPPEGLVIDSKRDVHAWFTQTAPLIHWTEMDSPLGSLYLASSSQGLCAVGFGQTQDEFLGGLDPLARTEHNVQALAGIARQLREYFAGLRLHFDIPLDLAHVTPFQLSVLDTTRGISAGTVWTYGQMARALGKPGASRAVGQALGRNPVPIVIPCHRVVATGGGLGGYSGGGGPESKRLLLHHEGVRRDHGYTQAALL